MLLVTVKTVIMTFDRSFDSPAHCCSSRSGHGPSSPSNDLLARTALPNADIGALHRVLQGACPVLATLSFQSMYLIDPCLAAEGACVASMLGDFHLIPTLN